MGAIHQAMMMAAGSDPGFSTVVFLSHFDGSDDALTATDQKGHALTFFGAARLDTAQQKFGASGLLLNVSGDDASYASVTFLSHFDGADTATAAIETKSHALTFNGSAQIDTDQKKFGPSSLRLDGSGDFVSAVDSADWDFGSGDFTVELWIRFNSAAGDQAFASQYLNTGNQRGWYFRLSSGNTLTFNYSTDGINANTVQGSWTPSTGVWYHIAATRQSTTLRVSVDGAEIANGSIGTSTIFNSNTLLRVGCINSSGNTNFVDGWIDSLRITKGVGRYGSTYTVPTAPFADDTSDYITVSDSDDWAFGSGDFTLEAFVRFNSTSGEQIFCSHYDSNGQRAWQFKKASGGNLEFFYSRDGGAVNVVTASGTWGPSADTWYYVAAKRSGTSLTVWVDGSQVGTASAGTDSIHNSTTTLRIGNTLSSGVESSFLLGWLDELRITKGLARDVSVVPTSPFPNS